MLADGCRVKKVYPDPFSEYRYFVESLTELVKPNINNRLSINSPINAFLLAILSMCSIKVRVEAVIKRDY